MHRNGYYSRVIILLVLLVTVLPAPADEPAAITPIRNAREMLDARTNTFVTRPTYANFSVCYGNTCRIIAEFGLDHEEWNRIREKFGAAAASPAAEREQIRAAVAELEKITGEKTGTFADRGENLNGLGLPGQMDCVDEATNTTVYLTMMQVDNLLRWHTVALRTSRGLGSLQAPHFTAVIRDKNDDMRYAVDSWFLDNGKPPFVVPLPIWEKGWKPQTGAAATAGNEY